MTQFTCPFSIQEHPHIVMAHGGGGRLMKRLLDELILPALEGGENTPLGPQQDAAVLNLGNRIAMTTDSFVVKPLFFSGGDIGSLAVNGTVNDLAMVGAIPRVMSVALILEEGLSTKILRKILCSMRNAAINAGIKIVTGDTKVVEHGKGDGIYINTTGFGTVENAIKINSSQIQTGDLILISGDIGRHGVAVMAEREGLAFDGDLKSDCAPLHQAVSSMLEMGIDLHCLRDITRGGLSSTLNELAEATHLSFKLEETKIPIDMSVRSVCEVFGLDPLYVACEGRFVAFLSQQDADRALEKLRSIHKTAAIIGYVTQKDVVPVSLKNAYGGVRVLDMLSGEQLPRIC